MNGYEDGTFKSNKTVTRAEAATLFVNMMRTDEFRDTMTDINGEYEQLRANGHDVNLFDYFAKPTDTGEPFDTHWKDWKLHM